MKAHLFFAGAIGALTMAIVACSSSSGSATPGAGGATEGQVASCKQSCDKMKFFECNSADQQAACYSDCNGATSDQIDLFTGCANNSVCDPACRTNITPKPPAGQPASGGGGATAATCTSACTKLSQCSFIPVGAQSDCTTQCQASAYQYQIDCVNSTACAKIQATCGSPTSSGGSSGGGGGTGGGSGGGSGGGTIDGGGQDDFNITLCQSACDSISAFSCINATDHEACRNLCASAPASKRDSFRTCAQGDPTDCVKSTDCYAAFTAK